MKPIIFIEQLEALLEERKFKDRRQLKQIVHPLFERRISHRRKAHHCSVMK
ncbi:MULTISPECIES: hypothetical protein [Pseudoalteromonas]|uniref:Uncharacterized protein n=1 Tax=Pseudoalteromonas aurantia 208 TaxID=1314867 RepID=A0ABR9E5F4_9GAMM|nr:MULTISPECIES: hypothetical protein [Pseudoalteromonas]MBE0366235.1 hypothetical protein [Pseudoalteromonas aurantia 208]MBQ4846525.1 hypothetical protein [Pseudoalteromonas sp. MMG005]MBQ4849430.1 hypothetical protein [Pseudoalteromonas sp. MMG012]